jgi:hypothetical protein
VNAPDVRTDRGGRDFRREKRNDGDFELDAKLSDELPVELNQRVERLLIFQHKQRELSSF